MFSFVVTVCAGSGGFVNTVVVNPQILKQSNSTFSTRNRTEKHFMLISISGDFPFFSPFYEDILRFPDFTPSIFPSSFHNLLKQNCQMPISHSTPVLDKGRSKKEGKKEKS
jgi:hypothetical protein